MRFILQTFPAVLLTTLLLGCDSLSYPPNALSNRITFSEPAVGQKSLYLRFQGEDYRDPDNNKFDYVPDTLIVEIVDASAHTYTFLEYLTPGSVESPEFRSEHHPDSVFYQVEIKGDSLHVRGIDQDFHSSSLFAFYPNPLPLQPIQENPASVRGWKTTRNGQDFFVHGYVSSFTLLGLYYRRLNLVIDDTPMAYDGPGVTLMYDRNNGVVRSFSVSAWTGAAGGWDYLPESRW